jgi:ribosome-binding protein aMBF1 (putative translation factor)
MDPSSAGEIKRNQMKIREQEGEPAFGRNLKGHVIFLPVQCRMARGALGLSIRDLAASAKVSADTVVRFERGEDLKERTVEAIRSALEEGGVEFTNGDQPGIRLRKGLRT